MKLNINSKYKLWIIITVSVLLVGFTLLAIFGFNQTPDYKTSKEVVVTMDNQYEATTEELEDLANKYFESVNVKTINYATKRLDGPVGKYTLIFKIDSDAVVDAEKMAEYINAKLQEADYQLVNVEVAFNDEVKPFHNSEIGWICLAVGLTVLAVFIYLFFMEKIASALSVIASSILASLLFVAIVAGTRIPAAPFVYAVSALVFGLTSFLSTGLVARFGEQIKANEGMESKKDKLSYLEIAEKGAKDSFFRYAFVLSSLLVASVVMLILGSVYIKFLGLQLIVAGVSAVFASLVGIPLLWPVLKNFKK